MLRCLLYGKTVLWWSKGFSNSKQPETLPEGFARTGEANLKPETNFSMKKIYHLGTCDTCRKIIKSLPNIEGFTLQDIKKEPFTEAELGKLHKLAGSYEALFSRRATLYKERGLKNSSLQRPIIKT